jgi:O-antigen/teichoic acid export membrane protein
VTHVAPASADREAPAEPDRHDAPVLGLRSVAHGLSWNTFGQILGVVANIVLTPWLFTRYGGGDGGPYWVLALAATLSVTLTLVDGGIGAATTRFVAVHTGAGERDRISRLLVTVASLLIVIGGVICAALYFGADALVGVLKEVSPSVHDAAVTTVQLTGPLVLFALFRGSLTSVLAAAGRWREIASVTVVTQVGYVCWVVACLVAHSDVTLVVAGLVVQQAVACLLTFRLSHGAFRAGALRVLPWGDIKEFLRYALAAQVTNLAAVVNTEADALVISVALPAANLGPYGIGSGLATQVRSVPLNGLSPLQAMLGNRMGRHGEEALREQYRSVQRIWVRCVVPLAVIAAATALAAVPVWVPKADDAGTIAAVLLLGHAVNLATGPLTVYVQTVGRPGLETRYGVLGMIVNVALTIPLAIAFGLIGVVVATAIGQLLGSLYFAVIARRSLEPPPRSFLREFPVLPVLVGAPIAYGLVWAVGEVVPTGPIGLVLCSAVGGLVLLVVLFASLPGEAGRMYLRFSGKHGTGRHGA